MNARERTNDKNNKQAIKSFFNRFGSVTFSHTCMHASACSNALVDVCSQSNLGQVSMSMISVIHVIVYV